MNTINDFASKIIREFRKSYQMTILIKNVLLSFYLDRIRSMLMFRTHHRWNSISELTRANNHNYFSAPEFSRDFKGLTFFFAFSIFLQWLTLRRVPVWRIRNSSCACLFSGKWAWGWRPFWCRRDLDNRWTLRVKISC